MNESDQHDSKHNLEAPTRLVSALKEVSRREIFIPPYVDQAILKAAQERLAPRAKARFGNFRRWMLWPALAAVCVLIACLVRLFDSTQYVYRSNHTVEPLYAHEDLNHDGKVDILDAFALARQIKSSAHLSASLDVNGDGVVDGRDVALIAAHAVQLKPDKGS
jgi:hypothetical protein